MTARDDSNWGWEFVVEDFVYDRLIEDQANAEQLPNGPGRDAALARAAALRELLSEHSIYVTPPDTPQAAEWRKRDEANGIRALPAGTSAGRCITCPPVCGVPCTTVMALARYWIGHPDFPHAYQEHRGHGDTAVIAAGTFRRLHWPETVSAAT
jgi:hypothetical protein